MSKAARAIPWIVALVFVGADAASPAAYFQNFESLAAGKPPDELMILNGAFSIVKVENNTSLELAGDPIDGDGALFGPDAALFGEAGARIWAAPTGQRFPEFGIGVSDAGGYKLIAVPATATLELRRGDDVAASARFDWKPAAWTQFRLRVTDAGGGKCRYEAKAWTDGAAEPKWMLNVTDSAPSAGRPSIWGMPYSEKPIRFDDLSWKPG